MSSRMDSDALIEAVKRRPSLWSKQESSGLNIEQKNMIWREIAQEINQPVEKCKAKWRNLRDSYQKSVKYRQELEAIGKLSIYHEYRHEAALSFLEVGTKRKSEDRKSRSSKRPREESYETSMETSYGEYLPVEYLIETENNEDDATESQGEDSQLEEDQEIITSEITTSPKIPKIENEEGSQNGFNVIETTVMNEASSNNQDEVYQEIYGSETQNLYSNELDPWLKGVKETLMSLPKLMRARAKKQINDLVSDFEIKYLESIDVDQNQHN